MVAYCILDRINKLQVMQNAALRTATGCTQDTNIQHLHDETLPIHEHLQLHASQYKQKTSITSHPLHNHTAYFNTPKQKKNSLFLTTADTQQTFPQTSTQSLQQKCSTYCVCKVTADQVAHQLLLNGKGNKLHVPRREKMPRQTVTESKLASPYLMEDLLHGVKALKNNKAAGIDDMLCEQIKHFGEATLP